MTKAAVIQMTSSPEVRENLVTAFKLLSQAAEQDVRLAVLPENFAFMGLQDRDKLAMGERDGDGVIQNWLAATARDLRMWIIGGTMPMRVANASKVAAACLVINDSGERVARYDKIHLFDVDIPGRDEGYRESATIEAGSSRAIVDTPIGRVGLGVCYDMRFPELFRSLVRDGAQILSLPSAFTVPTGQAHWDVLLRARAIENLSYVLAPAQVGQHANGRLTYGNALIINSWGEVIARAIDEPSIAVADIDLAAQAAIRTRFPALMHIKLLS